MSRRLRTFLIVLSLLWQPLSALGPAALDERAEQYTHVVAHGQALAHHHLDDASLDLAAGEEVAHQHQFDSGHTPGLPAGWARFDGPVPPTAFVPALVPMPPSADLEGLLRPPRSRIA